MLSEDLDRQPQECETFHVPDTVKMQLATKTDTQRIEGQLLVLKGQLLLLKWMIGFNLAFTMAIVWKVFS